MGKIVHISDDGEVLNTFNDHTHYIRSEAQNEHYKKRETSKLEFETFNNETGKFIWSYPARIKELIKSDDYNKSDLTMIFYLATYVNGTGYLAYDNQVKLKKGGLMKVLNISRNQFGKLYNKLIEHEILISVNEHYQWNQNYNFYGTTKRIAKPNELVRTYVKQIRDLYEAKTDSGKRKNSAVSLYPVFALVPYLHVSTNIICSNPTETDTSQIDYYTLTEIAEKLDLKDSKKMSCTLSSIKLSDQYVFRKVEIKNEKYLQMNPRIFWKNTTIPNAQLIAEFDMVKNKTHA